MSNQREMIDKEVLIKSRDARCVRCRWMRSVAAQPR